jgi:hypothetical protein
MSDAICPKGILKHDAHKGTPKEARNQRVSILPHTQIYPPPVSAHTPVDKGNSDVQEFKIFYSNLSSLSLQATDYIFALPKEVKVLALLELHKEDVESVVNKFSCNNYRAYYNPPEPAVVGNHGGELVACKSHLSSSPVLQEILEHIASHFAAPLRFSVCFTF